MFLRYSVYLGGLRGVRPSLYSAVHYWSQLKYIGIHSWVTERAGDYCPSTSCLCGQSFGWCLGYFFIAVLKHYNQQHALPSTDARKHHRRKSLLGLKYQRVHCSREACSRRLRARIFARRHKAERANWKLESEEEGFKHSKPASSKAAP